MNEEAIKILERIAVALETIASKPKARGTPKAKGDKSAFVDKFNDLWSRYPLKRDKQVAFRNFCLSVKLSEFDDFDKAMTNYVSSLKDKDAKYIKYFKTFVSGWRDWINPERDDQNFDSSKPDYDKLLKGIFDNGR